MTEEQIQEIADRVIRALENLEPGGTNWWAVIIPPIAVLAAAYLGFWQKQKADARAEWWRRAQWALEAKASENKELKENGLAMLDVLTESNLAGEDEREFIRMVTDIPTSATVTDEDVAGEPDAGAEFMAALRASNPDASEDDLRIGAKYAAAYRPAVDEPDEDGDNSGTEEDRR